MKINSLRKLNRNDYERILIRYNNEKKEFQIDVKNDNKYETIKTLTSFSNYIKSMSEINKVREVIKYFINNTNINFIFENEYISRYLGAFLIFGNNERELLFNNIENVFDNELKQFLINKYVIDRIKFLNNNDVKNIIIRVGNECEYKLVKNEYEHEPYMEFHLKSYLEELIGIDKSFLINLISSLINQTESSICTEYIADELYRKMVRIYRSSGLDYRGIDLYAKVVHEKNMFNERYGFHIYIGDCNIILDKKYYNIYIKDIIDKYNDNIKTYKEKQLSLFD